MPRGLRSTAPAAGEALRSESVGRGSILLTAAQVWHAATGYAIFIAGYHMLGKLAYADFMVVVWTMTTLEILVVDGLPRSVSYFTARNPGAAGTLARRGILLTVGAALLLGALLWLLAPVITGRIWADASLTGAVRLSGLDFLAFAVFAVMTQAMNGLRRYTLQAAIWLSYSTLKLLLVVSMMAAGHGVAGAIAGYVLASAAGSVAAWLLGRKALAGGSPVPSPAPGARGMFAYGLPLAVLSLSLMAFLNADLWAVKPLLSAGEAGRYAAAATLGRALFFVFKAVGDALFPAVAAAASSGDSSGARRAIRGALGWLFILLLPVAGMAWGGAGPAVATVYGESSGGAAELLRVLAPGSALWTLAAVGALALAGLGRPWRAALALLAVALAGGPALRYAAGAWGAEGVAWAGAGISLLALCAVGIWICGALPGAIPFRFAVAGLLGGVLGGQTLRLLDIPGIWVFPAALLLLLAFLALLHRTAGLPSGPENPSP